METKQLNIPQRKKKFDTELAPSDATKEEDPLPENEESVENEEIEEDEELELEEPSEDQEPVPAPGGEGLRLNFVRPLTDYFKHLEQKLIDELSDPEAFEMEDIDDEFPDIVATDELQFDELSVNAAITLCGQLEKYVGSLSDEQFLKIQSIYLFYESSEQLLDMVKLLFIGNLVAKEKVIRIYGSKVLGTSRVVQMILDASSLFEEMEDADKQEAREQMLKYAEDPLRQFKKFFLASEQAEIPDTGKGLSDGVRNTLANRDPLFEGSDDYNQILENFRSFIMSLYTNPFVLEYVQWKEKYMRNWLFYELYQLDIQNMSKSEIKSPQCSLIKYKIYQQLDTNFSSLDRSDRIYDKSLELRKTHYRALSHGEAFLPDGEEEDRVALEKAREAEKVLLDSLNSAQINSIAEKVHLEIAKTRRNRKLKGDPPANANLRAVDMGTEKEAEKKYTAATAKIQITEAKQKKGSPPPQFLKAMGKLAKSLMTKTKKAPPPPVEEVVEEPPEPDILPRAEGNTEGLLEMAAVDWVGYGKEFKTTIYERAHPNMQQRFFEHGPYKIHLNEDFMEVAEVILNHYREAGCLKTKKHKMALSGESGDGVQSFNDEVGYFKINPEMFLALGKAPFSKNTPPFIYLQIYQSTPIKVKKAVLKHIDFARMVDGTKYELEDIENANPLRPLLFRSLIKIIDSLPDNLRDQHQTILKGMSQFLESEHAS